MNDKDKEAFEKWFLDNYKYKYTELVILEAIEQHRTAWQEACLYKQKEIDELFKQLKHEHDIYKKHLKVYEDENAKLRECVEEISKMRQEVSFYVEPTYPAMICIQVLKELEQK